MALREAGKDEQALAVLQGYTTAHPDGPHAAQAKQLAAACLSKLNRPDEAKQCWPPWPPTRRPPTPCCTTWPGRSATRRTWPGRRETYRRLLKEHPDSKLAPAARSELAELLYNDKKYDEAAELLEAVVKDKSADPEGGQPRRLPARAGATRS